MTPCPPPDLLAAFVAGVCADEDRATVDAHVGSCGRCAQWLVDSNDQAFLAVVREVVAGGRVGGSATVATEPDPGGHVAGYRVVRQIGAGGMGVVYEAEQQSPRRRVALKIVRGAFASARTLRRFELEVEVLGRLSHPGIAQVFEAGTFDSGHGPQPFFAMELVRGPTLLDWVRTRRPYVAERVALFAGICDAVHHAHQKGVIHRDLKPGNVLVDEAGQPKVLDFGVARVVHDDAGDVRSLATLSGQLVGTVPYMSPEQVRGDGSDIDVTSDVYSLGVLLYELLVARLPYALEGLGIAEQARIVAERDPTPLGAVDGRLRGDLETIVRKALQKDRGRRYQSAAELGADARRWLRREPISARPPHAGYQLVMFARRHRTLVAGIIAVVVVLCGGIVATWTQAVRAERALAQAVATRDFLQEVMIQASPSERGGAEPTLRRVFEIALQRVGRDLLDKPAVEAAVRHTLGRVQLAMGYHDDAKAQLTRSSELYASAPARDDDQLRDVLAHLGLALTRAGEFDAAERAVERALALPGSSGGQILGSALSSLGAARYANGRAAEAEQSFRAAIEAFDQAAPGQREVNVPVTQGMLALVLVSLGRTDEAERLYNVSLDRQRQRGVATPELATTAGNFGAFLRIAGRLDEAEELQREAVDTALEVFGDDHPMTGYHKKELGLLKCARGDLDTGLREARDGLEMQARHLGRHFRVLQTHMQLGDVFVAAGRRQDAEDHFRDALAIGEETGPRHWMTNQVRVALGKLLVGDGRAQEALAHLQLAHEIARESHAGVSSKVADSGDALARALDAVGRAHDAAQVRAALQSPDR